jgi:Cof subfamily protein (haloacid dehalogenase superfamily)
VPRPVSPDPLLPIELIALDIDGTLIGDDLVIGPDTRRAVKAARRKGVRVSIVTGRMVSSGMRFAHELGLDAPIVGYQGGLIRAMPEPGSTRLGRLLRHSPLPAAVARDIVRWTRAKGLEPHVNRLERFLLRADDPNADELMEFMGAAAEPVPDLFKAVNRPATKVLAAGEPPLPESLFTEASKRFSGVADVTISHPRFLEFVAPGVSKGRAVRWLARHFKVRLGAALAIGDQWNDLEMIAEVGHGTAMPSAPAPVQRAARYIAPPLADEGVARMIEALVLARPAAAKAASERMAAAADDVRAGFETADEAADVTEDEARLATA